MLISRAESLATGIWLGLRLSSLFHLLLFLHFFLLHLTPLLLLASPLHCPGSPCLPRPYPQPFNSLLLPTVPGHPCSFPTPGISGCIHLPCRMPQLSLSCLGLGPAAASLWLFLPLAGASCLLAYILTQAYAMYENSHHLRCFPQPPKRNWLLGHLGLVSVAVRVTWGFREEGIVRSLEWAQGSGDRDGLGSSTAE